MSATNRGAIRKAKDAYFTPVALAHACCLALWREIERPAVVLEPTVGGGAFVEGAALCWGETVEFVVHDIQSSCREEARSIWSADSFLDGDAVDYSDRIGLAVGNPPYLLAERFVRECLACVQEGGYVAFLLRVGFFGSKERLPLWRERNLRFVAPSIVPRPSFTDDGKTDASEYGFFVWQRGYQGRAEVLPPIEWLKKPLPVSRVAQLLLGERAA